jgi:hypothetical protein
MIFTLLSFTTRTRNYASLRSMFPRAGKFFSGKILLIKVFTLKFSESTDGFQDEPVRAFMLDKEITSVREHFFIRNNVPYLVIVISYTPGSAQEPTVVYKSKHSNAKKDYRAMLTDASTPFFNMLREWRRERAMKDGVPPYVIFTNSQIAEIASICPENLNQLSTIEGVGKAKLEKYGKDVLGVLQSTEKNMKSENLKAALKTRPGEIPTKNASLWGNNDKKDQNES